ncbi:MAG: TonB-dependent receptor, partial [Methylophilaceae bacterium]
QALNIGSNVVINSSQYARGDENNLDSNGKVPGYTVVHVDVNYSVNENWRLFAKVNNLFDRNYSTFGLLGENVFAGGAAEQFRTPAAPRAAWVGVTYDFGRSRKTGAQPDRD